MKQRKTNDVQEPLTTAMLAAAPMQEQKQMLGERLFPLIQVARAQDKDRHPQAGL